MRKNRVVNRCYHLVSRLAHRAFFLDDEEKDRAAGAVLLASIGSAVVGCVIFVPKLLRFFTSHAV